MPSRHGGKKTKRLSRAQVETLQRKARALRRQAVRQNRKVDSLKESSKTLSGLRYAAVEDEMRARSLLLMAYSDAPAWREEVREFLKLD